MINLRSDWKEMLYTGLKENDPGAYAALLKLIDELVRHNNELEERILELERKA